MGKQAKMLRSLMALAGAGSEAAAVQLARVLVDGALGGREGRMLEDLARSHRPPVHLPFNRRCPIVGRYHLIIVFISKNIRDRVWAVLQVRDADVTSEAVGDAEIVWSIVYPLVGAGNYGPSLLVFEEDVERRGADLNYVGELLKFRGLHIGEEGPLQADPITSCEEVPRLNGHWFTDAGQAAYVHHHPPLLDLTQQLTSY